MAARISADKQRNQAPSPRPVRRWHLSRALLARAIVLGLEVLGEGPCADGHACLAQCLSCWSSRSVESRDKQRACRRPRVCLVRSRFSGFRIIMEVSYYRLMALIARNYAIAAGRSETMKMVVVIARWVASRCLGGRQRWAANSRAAIRRCASLGDLRRA